jgi:hypothetical protein
MALNNAKNRRFQPEDAKLLNKTEAAEYFGVSRRTIHNWVAADFGPVWFKLPGGREVTTLKSCEQFIERQSGGQMELPLGDA